MRRNAMLFMILLVAASCGDSTSGPVQVGVDPVATSTSIGLTSTSSVAESTTKLAGAAVTFVSVPETTSSTTTEVVDPTSLVVGYWGILGYWDGSGWLSAEGAALEEIPAVAGELYKVLTLDGASASTVVSEGVGLVCGIIDNWGVPTSPALDSFGGRFPVVAVRAEWDIQPQRPEILSGQPDVYLEALGQFLTSHGLGESEAVIHQIVRVDLEGDGVDEVLIAAESIVGEWPLVKPGDYSVVLMRKVIEGEVQVAVLGFSFVAADADPDQFQFMERFRISALADLNGDSQLEILMDSEYYEGVGVQAFEYIDDDLGLVAVIGTGCGA